MTGWNLEQLNRKALVALVLLCLSGFFAMAKADTATSYEKMVGSLVNMMTRTNTADAVVLPEETKVRIRGLIEEVRAGRLNFECIDAFNNYNFCELANKILGDLYKSHGCLHVSPVNARVLNEVLPIGSMVEIKPYNVDYDREKAKSVPSLISLIDFNSDLKNVKSDLASKAEVKTVIYPEKGAYVIYLRGEPYAALKVNGGTKEKLYMLQYRDDRGYPMFDGSLAGPTSPGKLYVFKKVANYVSNIYREQTIIPMGAVIRKIGGKWMFEIAEDEWRPAPEGVAQDLEESDLGRQYAYFEILKDIDGKVIQARWASNTFGSYPILLSRDMKRQAPELIHTTGELMVDQYSMLSVMVDLLSQPYRTFDQCVESADRISDIKGYFDFDRDPSSGSIKSEQSAYYKLYFDLPLLTEEAEILPEDAVIANKIVKKQGGLSSREEDILVREGLAKRGGGRVVVNMKKIYGLQFDAYLNVVLIKKYANLYSVLRDNWDDLSELRRIIASDMKSLSILDPVLYRRFAVELIMKRIGLKKLTQEEVLDELSHTLGL